MLPICWSLERQEWDLTHRVSADISGGASLGEDYDTCEKIFNDGCGQCHATQYDVGFDAQTNSYASGYWRERWPVSPATAPARPMWIGTGTEKGQLQVIGRRPGCYSRRKTLMPRGSWRPAAAATTNTPGATRSTTIREFLLTQLPFRRTTTARAFSPTDVSPA